MKTYDKFAEHIEPGDLLVPKSNKQPTLPVSKVYYESGYTVATLADGAEVQLDWGKRFEIAYYPGYEIGVGDGFRLAVGMFLFGLLFSPLWFLLGFLLAI